MITFNFAWAWLLPLLVLPWLVPFFVRSTPAQSVLLIPQLSLFLSNAPVAKSLRKNARNKWAFFALWSLLVLAAARPQWGEEPVLRQASGRDWMFLLDVSASMATADLPATQGALTRLVAAQNAARSFLPLRQADRVGLIVFAAQAWLYTPLTWDLAALDSALASVQTGLAGRETAIGDAIALAIKRLREGAKQGFAGQHELILLTDGENNAGSLNLQQAAWLAMREGVRINAVEIAPAAKASPSGSLLALTAQTGGQYARITDVAGLQAFFAALQKQNPPLAQTRWLGAVQELYPWPLSAALLLGMVFFWMPVRLA